MATITRENIGLLNDKIVVKVATDDYLPSFEKVLKDYSKKANIPGFRKGMVPVGMVKKMYGSSIFQDEVIKSVEKGLSDYMTNEKLEIFANPLPLIDESPKIDMNQPVEYAFSFEVGLKPEFSLPDLGSLHLTRYKVIITDEAINNQLERFLDQYAETTDADSITSDENVLDITFTPSDAEGNETPDAITKNLSLPLKDFTPPVREQLMGKSNNEHLVIQLSQAFDNEQRDTVITNLGLSKEDPATADQFFKITIANVGLVEKPSLNAEFFKKVFPDKDFETEEDFRNEIKEELQAQWDAQTRNQLHDQLYHELLNHTHIDFPQDFLKRWMQTGLEKPKTPDEVEHDFPTFSNQLKWSLITDKLDHENDIQVGPEDIRNFAKNQLLGYMGGKYLNIDQPWINDYIDRMMKDKKFVEDSFHRIRTDKVFAVPETKINPVESPISEDDFTKMVEAHHHHH